ncbi:dimethyl sulfoxide reductase anchor subunit [Sneathiella marina]|uniref:Dimethyl sulfoxide reductase anchor subunit n=1 Tax=Sneathiella marina TaxID=2950108 RepID=A0ABY4WEK6_9PROT|nr:DmsC/YnfH family molybdoenzyme membrane anchor subunit [Sneathiella marina]USG63071.1 dimethyl sulfoxide reductase anchor subunit [Sneathiella marina]
MHPAKSVIFFTTSSGAGYGLLFALILGNILSALPTYPYFLLSAYAVSFVLIGCGLLSSTFHLGHPERAWRALSQWRSSWLSREGVLAVLTFVPAGIYASYLIFFSEEYFLSIEIIGVIAVVCCVSTVYCTAMIYASLKTVHAWSNWRVPAGYLLLSLTTGCVILSALMFFWGYQASFISVFAVALLLISAAWKHSYWQFLDRSKSASSPESATGLGEFGKVRQFEVPHTEANYLNKEMGFVVARKHSVRLRQIVFVCAFFVPAILLMLTLMLGAIGAGFAAGISIVSLAMGILVERWLFFAEAKHTVNLYYGAHEA